ncbi:DUF2000 domain-containing protein [Amycolatopsis acidiphila]|uniref:DUF2000 domain-containing protein n=1 Tax=Amycolatopsis acidiphila TaxID=715473 RepID=A0A557ZWU6_9PSEU|nr:DUF2000 domain-containing protein [Amycolatopsis acidiphila]TVT16481.1 DUF2000 domain-containing protein [Amycolatopsis acidiphila]UIJ60882.1 DUF2000 domain-containing protein [Amycolatopsis acidiphila]GHG94996.1 hypothetical protein GCM10017788_73200 [Amycolatopsis acidiphila]
MQAKTKIAVVVRDDLATWQRLNVTAFLVSGVAARFPETVGVEYEDASGQRYLPMFGQPVLVYAAAAGALTAAHQKAVERELAVAVYTEELFVTGNDVDNRAAVRAVPTEKLALAGIAVRGPRNAVDKAFKGLSLHP